MLLCEQHMVGKNHSREPQICREALHRLPRPSHCPATLGWHHSQQPKEPGGSLLLILPPYTAENVMCVFNKDFLNE